MTAFIAAMAFMAFLGSVAGSYLGVTTLLWWQDYKARKTHARS